MRLLRQAHVIVPAQLKICADFYWKNFVILASEIEIDKLRELHEQERRRMSVLSERAMINNNIESFKIFNNSV